MPRVGLTASQIVEAAADFVDRSGWEALKLSAIADRFRVKLPSLYKHVAGLEDLRRRLRLFALERFRIKLQEALTAKSGQAAFETFCRVYRDFARTRPGVYAGLVQAPDPSDRELTEQSDRLLAVVFKVLESFGLRDNALVHQTRILRSALHGFVTLECSGGFGLPQSIEETFKRMVAELLVCLKEP